MGNVVFVKVTSLERPADTKLLAYGILLHYPENRGTKILQNFGNYGSVYTGSHLRKIIIINTAVVTSFESSKLHFLLFFISMHFRASE